MEPSFQNVAKALFSLVLVGIIGILLNLNPNNKYNKDLQAFSGKEGIIEVPKYLMLFNSKNKVPDTYPYDLAEYEGYWVDQTIYDDLKEMVDAASKDGISLVLTEAYLSYGEQKEIYETQITQYVADGLSKEQAVAKTNGSYSAPGYGEHQTGLAIDFLYREDSYDWLMDHAYQYGFILRYPSSKEDITKMQYNPSHYRYVGRDAALVMHEEDYCFEEYYQHFIHN